MDDTTIDPYAMYRLEADDDPYRGRYRIIEPVTSNYFSSKNLASSIHMQVPLNILQLVLWFAIAVLCVMIACVLTLLYICFKTRQKKIPLIEMSQSIQEEVPATIEPTHTVNMAANSNQASGHTSNSPSSEDTSHINSNNYIATEKKHKRKKRKSGVVRVRSAVNIVDHSNNTSVYSNKDTYTSKEKEAEALGYTSYPRVVVNIPPKYDKDRPSKYTEPPSTDSIYDNHKSIAIQSVGVGCYSEQNFEITASDRKIAKELEAVYGDNYAEYPIMDLPPVESTDRGNYRPVDPREDIQMWSPPPAYEMEYGHGGTRPKSRSNNR